MNADRAAVVARTLQNHGWNVDSIGHGVRIATHTAHPGRTLHLGKGGRLTWINNNGSRPAGRAKDDPGIAEAKSAASAYDAETARRQRLERW